MIAAIIFASLIGMNDSWFNQVGLCDLDREEYRLLKEYDSETLEKIKDGTIECDAIGDSIDFGRLEDMDTMRHE